jgi:hypothetical protein
MKIDNIDLSRMDARQLLALHAQLGDELRARGITRSFNNPTGDIAELMFCKAFGWTQAGNAHAHVDAIGPDGIKYQIKGRRITAGNPSRQLGALRQLDGAHFNFLAAVLFSQDYSVLRAAIIPHTVVIARATFQEHTNGHRFILHDDVWNAPDVRDVTAELRAVSL